MRFRNSAGRSTSGKSSPSASSKCLSPLTTASDAVAFAREIK